MVWSLTADDLADLNDGTTWGWTGCGDLAAGQSICLSKGNPPMPAVLPNAIRGLQVPNTTVDGLVEDARDLPSLNPCPLNACYEEDGCATLTGWEWTEATDNEGAMASSNTDFFMKAGCVERTIVSAGGAKIQCDGQRLTGLILSRPRSRLLSRR